jgi:hypothetical protein
MPVNITTFLAINPIIKEASKLVYYPKVETQVGVFYSPSFKNEKEILVN